MKITKGLHLLFEVLTATSSSVLASAQGQDAITESKPVMLKEKLHSAREMWIDNFGDDPSSTYTYVIRDRSPKRLEGGNNDGRDGEEGSTAKQFSPHFLPSLNSSRFSDQSPIVVEVRNGTVTDAYPKFQLRFIEGVPLSSRSEFAEDDGFSPNLTAVPTILDFFDFINATIQRKEDDLQNNETALVVEYDDFYGYPTLVRSYALANETDVFLDIAVAGLVPYSLLKREADFQLALWTSSKDVFSSGGTYSFIIQYVCSCLDDYVTPKRVSIQNDKVVSVTDLSTGLPASTNYVYPTMEDLFRHVFDSTTSSYDVGLRAKYNETVGFPTLIYRNPSYAIADGDWTIRIGNVTWG